MPWRAIEGDFFSESVEVERLRTGAQAGAGAQLGVIRGQERHAVGSGARTTGEACSQNGHTVHRNPARQGLA